MAEWTEQDVIDVLRAGIDRVREKIRNGTPLHLAAAEIGLMPHEFEAVAARFEREHGEGTSATSD